MREVVRWFAAVQVRPSFATAITQFSPTPYDDELRSAASMCSHKCRLCSQLEKQALKSARCSA